MALPGPFWRTRFHRATQDAAVRPLPFLERWERGAQAQLFRVARVHARNERRDEVFQNLMPKFAPHKLRDGFFFRRRLGAPQCF